MHRGQGDADARADVEVGAPDRHRAFEAAEHPPRHRDAVLRAGRRGEQDRELVAAEARHQILGPRLLAQALGDALEQEVAVMVAERVVDLLEPVQVHHQHADLALAGGRLLQRGGEARVQVRAVGQAGERVVRRLVLVEHRLTAAELDRDERDPQQRDQRQVVVRDHEHRGHECEQHRGGHHLEDEVGAHRGERADAAGERGRRARQRDVDEEERRGRGAHGRDGGDLEVLEAAVGGRARPGEHQDRAGGAPRERVLRGVEHQLGRLAPADEVRGDDRDDVDEDDLLHTAGQEEREREGGGERRLALMARHVEREELGDQDREREEHD